MSDGHDPASEDKTVMVQSDAELAQHRPALPYLIIVDGPRTGTRFHLIEDENLMGRAPGCHILLDDQSVSRRHCAAVRDEDTITLRDLGSKNGTIVNNRPLTDALVVGHGDLVQTGIYTLRLITKEVPQEEELAPIALLAPQEAQPADGDAETSTVMADVDEPLDDFSDDLLDEVDPDDPSEIAIVEAAAAQAKSRRWIVYVAFVLMTAACAGGGYWAYTQWFTQPEEAAGPMIARIIPEEVEVAPEESLPAEPVETGPVTVPVFLDFAASPMPARVMFDERNYGMSPIKVNATLTVGETYVAEGHFEMPELKETHVERVNVVATAQDSMLPIFFRAPIGMFKIEKLPRDVQLAIEGYFASDPYTPHHANITNISYGKPMYMPYGRYIIELRQEKEIGESGQYVPDIRYRREIFLSQDAPTFKLHVENADLDQFPVEIRSTPSGADVFVDARPVGKTPYKGTFTLGEHTLVLRKEGYLEYSQALQNDINILYHLDVPLKTTEAGEFLNAGRRLVERGNFEQAVVELAKVFEHQPAPGEKAHAQYRLGVAYLGQGDLERAQGYFKQAEVHPEYAMQAKLGLVRVLHAQEKRLEALPLLVEVMLRAPDGPIKAEASHIFKEVSPLKSVLYIHTQPEGATVLVNDEAMPTQTPLIVHDLGLGNYRVRIEAEGYQPKELNINLTVHEFNPVIVRMQELEE